MKTACTVLQEMMVRMGETPQYECTAQSGPAHSAMFEYRCLAHGVLAVATGGSKKEAKQESAKRALRALAVTGLPVPPPYGLAAPGGDVGEAAGAGPAEPPSLERNAVALLRDICEEYRLGAAEFTLVGDTGPPHLRHFTMRAAVGSTQRTATATTKKAARAQAAHQLYTYLKDNLARLTGEIDESAALARATERAMEKYRETREQTSRPHLGQCIADYPKALVAGIAEETLSAARAALAGPEPLSAGAAALGLSVSAVDSAPPPGPWLLGLAPSAPPLLFAAPPNDPSRAEKLALQYLQLALAE